MYARQRGVLLLPELDAPAHAAFGWQFGPEADLGNLATCANEMSQFHEKIPKSYLFAHDALQHSVEFTKFLYHLRIIS